MVRPYELGQGESHLDLPMLLCYGQHFEILSVGRKSIDLGHLFVKLVQLGCTGCTADIKSGFGEF